MWEGKKESVERMSVASKIAELEQTIVKLTGKLKAHTDENKRLRDDNGQLRRALGEHTGKQIVPVGDAPQGTPTDDDGGRVRAVATKRAKRRRANCCTSRSCMRAKSLPALVQTLSSASCKSTITSLCVL